MGYKQCENIEFVEGGIPYCHKNSAARDGCKYLETGEAQRWASVSERLPEDAFGCLLIVEDDDYWGEPRKVLLPYFAGYDGEQWNDGDGCRVRFEVTHWMELPTPPEEGAGK